MYNINCIYPFVNCMHCKFPRKNDSRFCIKKYNLFQKANDSRFSAPPDSRMIYLTMQLYHWALLVNNNPDSSMFEKTCVVCLSCFKQLPPRSIETLCDSSRDSHIPSQLQYLRCQVWFLSRKNIARLTVHTVISGPNPKQWLTLTIWRCW